MHINTHLIVSIPNLKLLLLICFRLFSVLARAGRVNTHKNLKATFKKPDATPIRKEIKPHGK